MYRLAIGIVFIFLSWTAHGEFKYAKIDCIVPEATVDNEHAFRPHVPKGCIKRVEGHQYSWVRASWSFKDLNDDFLGRLFKGKCVNKTQIFGRMGIKINWGNGGRDEGVDALEAHLNSRLPRHLRDSGVFEAAEMSRRLSCGREDSSADVSMEPVGELDEESGKMNHSAMRRKLTFRYQYETKDGKKDYVEMQCNLYFQHSCSGEYYETFSNEEYIKTNRGLSVGPQNVETKELITD